MLEILLIRHGQTDWNRDRRIMGRTEVPLNRKGRGQIRGLAKVLKKVPLNVIYTSPVLRAFETAKLLAKGRRVRLERAHQLAEIDYGEWIGKTFDEVVGHDQWYVYHQTPRDACPPGGEAMLGVHERAVQFVESLRQRHKKGRVALISHADVIKTILVHYMGLDLNDLLKFRIDNASISLLWFSESRSRVMAVNVLSKPEHLFDHSDQIPKLMKKVSKKSRTRK